jgi:hypothetical protein
VKSDRSLLTAENSSPPPGLETRAFSEGKAHARRGKQLTSIGNLVTTGRKIVRAPLLSKCDIVNGLVFQAVAGTGEATGGGGHRAQ